MKHKQPVNRRKIFWVIAIIAVAAGYQIAHPYIERQFNVELPSLTEDDDATVEKSKRPWNPSDWEIPDVDPQEPIVGEKATSNSRPSKQTPEVKSRPDKPPYLVPTGKKNRLRSPAGLVYGVSHGEHRVDHVMRHAQNDPSRPVHSVFDGDEEQILRLIDEAFILVKSNSNRVSKTPDKKLDFQAKYSVDMNRKIGYLGGQQGKRKNFPPCSKLTMILNSEKFIVTAYPDN